MFSPFWYLGDDLVADFADLATPLPAPGPAGVFCCVLAWLELDAKAIGAFDTWAMSIGCAGLDWFKLC
jgi:hypothetical protein